MPGQPTVADASQKAGALPAPFSGSRKGSGANPLPGRPDSLQLQDQPA
jgi:hypothetical protein